MKGRTNCQQVAAIGVGREGCLAVSGLLHYESLDIQSIAVDNDIDRVRGYVADTRILFGKSILEKDKEAIQRTVKGSKLIFVVGNAYQVNEAKSFSFITKTARHSGAFTIAIIIASPERGDLGGDKLGNAVIQDVLMEADTLIVFKLGRLLHFMDNCKIKRNVLRNSIQAIYELIAIPGSINVTINDLRETLENGNLAWVSIGAGVGMGRAIKAANSALCNPFLEVSLRQAKKVLFKITGGNDLRLAEANEVARIVQAAVAPEANIVFGVAHNPSIDQEVKVTLIASSFAS